MAFDRAAAKAAGYSDEEIDAYLQANPEVAKETPPAPAGKDEPPPPSTVIPEIDRTPETVATIGIGLGPAALGAAGAYGAYELGKRVIIPGVVNAAVDAMDKRAAAKGAVAPTATQGSPVTETTGPVKPSGQPVRTVNITGEVPSSGPVQPAAAQPANAAGRPMSREAQQYLAQQAERQAATQAARTAAPEAGSVLSRVAPYLQQAGRFLAPAARVAGPAGMVASVYEAAPYLKQAEVGPRAASGEVGRMVKGANRMALNMPTPAPLSAQEARNLLASGDERTINIYGGRQRLQAIANPNAMNSGYAQELRQLGR